MDRYPYLDPLVVERVDQHDKERYTRLAQEGMPPSGSFCLPGVNPQTDNVPTTSCSSHAALNPPSIYATPVSAPLQQAHGHHPQISSLLTKTPWTGFTKPDRTTQAQRTVTGPSNQIPIHQPSALQFNPNTP
jgi:hypothetical protein